MVIKHTIGVNNFGRLFVCDAVFVWGGAHFLLEKFVELGTVLETAKQADGLYGVVGVAQ